MKMYRTLIASMILSLIIAGIPANAQVNPSDVLGKLMNDTYGIVVWNASHIDLDVAPSKQVVMNRAALGLQYQFTFGQAVPDTSVTLTMVTSEIDSAGVKYTRTEKRQSAVVSKVGEYRMSLSGGYQHYYNFTLGDNRFTEAMTMGTFFVGMHMRVCQGDNSGWVGSIGLGFPSIDEAAVKYSDPSNNVSTVLKVSSSTAFAPEASFGYFTTFNGFRLWGDFGFQLLRLTGISYSANESFALKDIVNTLPTERKIASAYLKLGVAVNIF